MSTPQAQQITQNFLNHPYVQQVQKTAQGQLNSLDAELNKFPILRDIEKKTNVPKAYGVLALGASAVLLIFFNLFGLAGAVSNLIGWGLPAYLSIKAIETPSTNDDKQWLTYWVVFGTFNLIESFAIRPILYWIPLYYVFKTVFTIWLFLPATRGAEVLYFNVIRPFVVKGASRPAAPATSSFSTSSTGAAAAAPSSFEHEKTL
ncbi:Protein YOP1 [Vanrija pseudolonga]|uniref:Protein YOP1 n=1 Tax=Vanrija pseudolonga TaxID=143232 RepID=A0AAF1BMJ8_9TREE|nr:Protein YOP1 [Vanrija pseudolonga]